MFSDTSNAESGSDVDDLGPSLVQKVADYGCLTPVREEVGSLSYTFSLVIGSIYYTLFDAFAVLYPSSVCTVSSAY